VIFEDGPITHNVLLWLAFTNLADLDNRLVFRKERFRGFGHVHGVGSQGRHHSQSVSYSKYDSSQGQRQEEHLRVSIS
jgi:hypothetical protein